MGVGWLGGLRGLYVFKYLIAVMFHHQLQAGVSGCRHCERLVIGALCDTAHSISSALFSCASIGCSRKLVLFLCIAMCVYYDVWLLWSERLCSWEYMVLL